MLEYGSSVNTEKLVLVHGSVVAKNSLKEDLQKEISKKEQLEELKVVLSDGLIKAVHKCRVFLRRGR